MKTSKLKYGRIAIKTGSNEITTNDGSLDTARMLRLIEEIAVHCKQGTGVILNAKTRRVSVCNALDCLIIHQSRLESLY